MWHLIDAALGLKNNPNMVIKEADKGNTVAVMVKVDYTQEVKRQLSNFKF